MNLPLRSHELFFRHHELTDQTSFDYNGSLGKQLGCTRECSRHLKSMS